MELTKFSLIIAALSLSACSTIVNGNNQSVNVNTGAVTGADCLAMGGSKGAVNKQFQTPADVRFPRSSKAIEIRCEKPGYAAASETISGKVEGSTAGNLVMGGPVGLGVDALTGAVYKYPDSVSIEMKLLENPTVTGNPDPSG